MLRLTIVNINDEIPRFTRRDKRHKIFSVFYLGIWTSILHRGSLCLQYPTLTRKVGQVGTSNRAACGSGSGTIPGPELEA
ncbi:Hypothetical predicted protein [Marmota monax]|uniref:Uncharacterized protein n=1 Tax=Marmota monax TaxID=9995 RepID=A0A5E4CAR9_MARMO|nr:Hypothetical predicted protein [Marmota monax]